MTTKPNKNKLESANGTRFPSLLNELAKIPNDPEMEALLRLTGCKTVDELKTLFRKTLNAGKKVKT